MSEKKEKVNAAAPMTEEEQNKLDEIFQAMKNGRAGIVRCKRKHDGKIVPILVEHNRTKDGFLVIPLAEVLLDSRAATFEYLPPSETKEGEFETPDVKHGILRLNKETGEAEFEEKWLN